MNDNSSIDYRGYMKVLTKFTSEIEDFLTDETLKAIDYGILDLHKIENRELRETLYFIEELLTVELELNYLINETGIFRVSKKGNFWYYKQENYIIKAASLVELERKVTYENRIWYIFDEDLAKIGNDSKIFAKP